MLALMTSWAEAADPLVAVEAGPLPQMQPHLQYQISFHYNLACVPSQAFTAVVPEHMLHHSTTDMRRSKKAEGTVGAQLNGAGGGHLLENQGGLRAWLQLQAALCALG